MNSIQIITSKKKEIQIRDENGNTRTGLNLIQKLIKVPIQVPYSLYFFP